MSLEPRLLLGSGPSPVPERVLHALARPTVGHLDPQFVALMDALAEDLRAAFRTSNRVTLPLSATGSGGMQAMVDTLVAPGDHVVCGIHGLFGERMADALGRAGAEVVRVDADWGRAIEPDRLAEAWESAPARPRALFVVHGETSTGVAQPLDGLREIAGNDGLLLVDCVTSLAGHPLNLDASGVDAAFSGSQKCLNCPPGLAPISVADRATTRLSTRSWYFDLEAILGYWSSADGARAYHHTAPINMVYALREALRIVHEEGLDARWARHAKAHEALRSALGELGFARLAPDGEALSSLLCVRTPAGIDEAALRGRLLTRHGIEVSGGLGPLTGRVWRIGVMGEGARPEPQARLVEALAAELGVGARGPLAALEDGWR